MRRLFGRERVVQQVQRRRLGTGFPALHLVQRHDQLRRLPHLLAAVRTREHPYDRREDLPRLRRGLCPRPGAEPDGSVRPRGERRLPCAEGHGALDRSHAALQRVDAQRRHPQLCVGLPVVRPRALGRRSRSRQGRDGFRGRGAETLLALPATARFTAVFGSCSTAR